MQEPNPDSLWSERLDYQVIHRHRNEAVSPGISDKAAAEKAAEALNLEMRRDDYFAWPAGCFDVCNNATLRGIVHGVIIYEHKPSTFWERI